MKQRGLKRETNIVCDLRLRVCVLGTLHFKMAEENRDDVEEESILYDLAIHAEWPQETETIVNRFFYKEYTYKS